MSKHLFGETVDADGCDNLTDDDDDLVMNDIDICPNTPAGATQTQPDALPLS